MTKPPTYDWRCPRCESINTAGASVCVACKHDVTYRAPTPWDDMRQVGLPTWRRIAVYALVGIGVPMFLIGLALLLRVYFLTSLQGMAWSAAATLLGAALTGLAAKLFPSSV